MFYTIQKRIKEILEAETIAGGRLSDVNSVHLGDFTLLAGSQYPAVFIDYDGGGAEGFSHRVNCEFQYNIYVYVMEDSSENSMEKLEDIYWEEVEGGSPDGIIPVLLSNMGFQAEGIPLRMTVGRTKAVKGKAESDRYTGAMLVPVTVTTIRNNG